MIGDWKAPADPRYQSATHVAPDVTLFSGLRNSEDGSERATRASEGRQPAPVWDTTTYDIGVIHDLALSVVARLQHAGWITSKAEEIDSLLYSDENYPLDSYPQQFPMRQPLDQLVAHLLNLD